jgi:hypothetical protein
MRSRPLPWLAFLLLLAPVPGLAQGPTSRSPGTSTPVQSPAPPAGTDPLDAVIVIAPRGGAMDNIAVAYWSHVTDSQIQQDFRLLASELRTRPVGLKIERSAPPGRPVLPSGTAEMPGLVNWSAGVLNLDPIIAALKRYHHLKITYLIFEKFDLTWPTGEQRRGVVHWKTEVVGQTISYDVWIDHAGPLPDRLPSTGQWGLTWVLIAGLAVGALLLVGGIFYLVYLVTHQRKPELAKPEGQ